MKANILCREEEKSLIMKALAGEQVDEGTYILDWAERERLRPRYAELKMEKVWFWIHGRLIHGQEELKAYIQKGIENKQWQLVKNVNDVLREYDLIEQNLLLHCYPSEIQIESTNICNARCIMCSHSYNNNRNGGMIDESFLDGIKDILPFLRMVYLHGNGEPFLNPALPGLIRAMAEYEIRFMTNTNLSILTDEILECISKYFTAINISCDGATKETFESIRRKLSFDTFYKNCRKLRDNCPDLRITMAAVSMRQNVEELPQMVELAAELGMQKIVFSQLCPDALIGNKYDTLEHYPNAALYYYQKALEKGKETGIEVVVPGTVEYQQFDAEAFEAERKLIKEADISGKIQSAQTPQPKGSKAEGPKVCGICDWVIKRPYMNLSRSVNLCCISQMKVLGDLKQNTFADIWNGEEYQNIRRKFLIGEIPDECLGCEFLLQNSLEYVKTTQQYMSQFEYKKERNESSQ